MLCMPTIYCPEFLLKSTSVIDLIRGAISGENCFTMSEIVHKLYRLASLNCQEGKYIVMTSFVHLLI